jgi:hypothetical protein
MANMGSSCEILERYVRYYTRLGSADSYFETKKRTDEDNNGDEQYFACTVFDHNETEECKLKFHFLEEKHEKAYGVLRDDVEQIQEILKRYIKTFATPVGNDVVESNRIRCTIWRDQVQALLYSAFTFPHYKFFRKWDTDEILARPLKKLRSVQHWEGIVILELAAWKAQCQLQMPVGANYSTMIAWQSKGWKECKVDLQGSNPVVVIVKSVQRFLDAPAHDISQEGNGKQATLHLSSPHEVLRKVLKHTSSDETVAAHSKYSHPCFSYCETRCQLCERLVDGRKEYHVKETCHLERLQGLESDLNRIKKVMWRYVTLLTNPVQHEVTGFLDQVRHTPWREAVQAGLYRYLFDPSHSSCDDDKERELLEEPLCKIRRYMYQECLVLLRLAAWKAQCLWQMPGNLDYLSSMQ